MTERTYKWVVVAMLWFVCLFNYADRQSIYSVFPLLKAEPGLQLTELQLGIVASSFMWVYAGAGWFAGLVGDRFRRKTVVLAGFLFWSVITLAFSFATRYWHLVALRAIEGFGEAFYFPAAMALLSAYHGKDTRSRAMGIHQSSVYVGTILGGTLGGAMGEYFGWRSSFLLLGGLGILFAAVLWVFLKEPAIEASSLESVPERRSAAAQKFIARASLRWMACADFCVPGAADLALAFPLGADALTQVSGWKTAIDAARRLRPRFSPGQGAIPGTGWKPRRTGGSTRRTILR